MNKLLTALHSNVPILADILYSGRRARTWSEVIEAAGTAVGVVILAVVIIVVQRKRTKDAAKRTMNTWMNTAATAAFIAAAIGGITYYGAEASNNHSFAEGAMIGAITCGGIGFLCFVLSCFFPPATGGN